MHNVYVQFCWDDPEERQYWPRIKEGENEGSKCTETFRGLWLVRGEVLCRTGLPDAAVCGTRLDAKY